MGIFFDAFKDMLKGRDDAQKWADPDCLNCKGSGYPLSARITKDWSRCYCVSNAIIGAATEHRREMSEQREAYEGLPTTPQRPAVNLAPLEGPVVELTPAQKEQERIEARIRLCVTLEAKQAMDDGQLTMCCASTPCKCGVNHWTQTSPVLGWIEPPDESSPWYAAWLHHKEFVMQLTPPAQRPGYWYPSPGFFDQ